MPDCAAPAKRVLLVASAGGHWVQLCRMAPSFQDFDCLFVCTAEGHVAPVGDRPVRQVPDGSRDHVSPLFVAAARLWGILREFRPDVVVSTGSAPGAVALVVARALGIRAVWIESVANCERLSLSGAWMRHVADLFVVQWPHLAQRHRGARYFGQVL